MLGNPGVTLPAAGHSDRGATAPGGRLSPPILATHQPTTQGHLKLKNSMAPKRDREQADYESDASGKSEASCQEAPVSGFPSLGALQGQWPARTAAPRSSKLNSVTRAGQRQPGTHSCSPARSHLPSPAYHLLPCARTFKLGKGRWKGRGTCHNSPHLNSAISPTLPPPHFIPPPLPFPLRSSQCPVCGGRDWVHIITSPQPEGTSIFRRTFHNLPIARCPNTLIIHFSSSPNVSRTFKLFSPISAPGLPGTTHPNNC